MSRQEWRMIQAKGRDGALVHDWQHLYVSTERWTGSDVRALPVQVLMTAGNLWARYEPRRG